MKKIALFAALTGCLWASDARVEFAAKAKAIRAATADLTQIVHMEGQNLEFSGRLYHKSPDHLRVEMGVALGDVRLNTISVSDGKTLTIYEDLMQTVRTIALTDLQDRQRLGSPETWDPSNPFKDVDAGSLRYVGEEAAEGVACALFEARMKTMAGEAGMIPADHARLWLGREDGFPRRLVLMDAQGREVIRQTYANVRINPSLADDLFRFIPPAGTHQVEGNGALLNLLGGEASTPSD